MMKNWRAKIRALNASQENMFTPPALGTALKYKVPFLTFAARLENRN